MMELKGKTIAITGAARGLGRAMALRLAQCGAQTALLDLDEEGLAEIRNRCEQAGPRSASYVVDITEEAQVETVFQTLAGDFGALDGLINNAGITRDALLVKAKDGAIVKKMSLADWDAVSHVDLCGVFLCTREAAARMIELAAGDGAKRSPGLILNISSISRVGNVGQTNYSAAKSGVAAMTVTWAKELARHQIRVAAIAPGFIRTTMVEKMPKRILDRLRAQTPLGRLGEPEEVAHAAQFAFENDFFNGRVLDLDGGLRL